MNTDLYLRLILLKTYHDIHLFIIFFLLIVYLFPFAKFLYPSAFKLLRQTKAKLNIFQLSTKQLLSFFFIWRIVNEINRHLIWFFFFQFNFSLNDPGKLKKNAFITLVYCNLQKNKNEKYFLSMFFMCSKRK